jgi:HEAT repeat protein
VCRRCWLRTIISKVSEIEIREQEVIAEFEADGLSNRRRRALLSKLRQVGTERSIDVLRANLRSADTKSQVRAVFALAHIGTEEAVDALIDSLAVTTGHCFTFAVKSLAEDHAARARPAFIRTLEERRDELDQGDKQVLVWALYQTPHRSEVPVLATLLGERSRSTRRMAAVALAQIKAPESRGALEEAVKSLSWLRGLQARRALRLLRYVSGE